MTKATLTQARAWLLELRALLNINESAQEADLAVRPIAASLIKSYDADVFRPESREAVSATLKFFREPDIRERLDAWRRLNAADAWELPLAAQTAPISAYGKWLYGRFLTAEGDRSAVRALDSARTSSPEDFDWMIRHDSRAAEIAVRHQWKPRPSMEELAAEWDDLDGILRLAGRVCDLPRTNVWEIRVQDRAINALFAAVKFNAPQHFRPMVDAMLARARGETVPVATPAVLALPSQNDALFGNLLGG